MVAFFSHRQSNKKVENQSKLSLKKMPQVFNSILVENVKTPLNPLLCNLPRCQECIQSANFNLFLSKIVQIKSFTVASLSDNGELSAGSHIYVGSVEEQHF